MSKEINRKGISLVALVITIIVLVVLTGAVVITGVNVPQQGQLAVFKNNVSSIQDVVTMKMLNNMVNYSEKNNENVKWIGVASGYTEESVANPPTFGTKINGVDVVALDASLKNEIQIKDDEFVKFYVDAKGTVYHTGFIYDGVKYYNGSTTDKKVISIAITSQPTKTAYSMRDVVDITGLVVTATYEDNSTQDVTSSCTFYPALSTATERLADNIQIEVSYGGIKAANNITIEVKNWYELASSNQNLATPPLVQEVINGTTYYAPVPKGFTVVSGTSISTGLVIQDSSSNQFVWVPVNESYTMVGDVTEDEMYHNRETTNYNYDIPYLDNNTTTALAYWQASSNGHSGTIVKDSSTTWTYSEPYTNAGSWETAEYQAMVKSVLKYGGFYVGRYETGGSISEPLVQAGKTPITSIKWNSTTTMDAEPTEGTAPYVARSFYDSTSADLGVVSTLMYGIQWDSIMCWAGCYNVPSSKTGVLQDTGTTGDCYKNIYDLAGNVAEWSMEARNNASRIFRGAYTGGYAVSSRSSNQPAYHSNGDLGFRTTLYVK